MAEQLPIISGSSRVDPLQGLKFRVRISNIPEVIGFTKITGLEMETAVVEYRESTDITTMRKLPGRVSYPVVTFEKGLDPGGFMYAWFLDIMDLPEQNRNAESATGFETKGLFRRDIEIDLFDRDGIFGGENGITWKLKNAWISKLSTGDLDANSDDVIIETAEIVHEGLSRAV